ncbi:MAG: hypothetical protein PVF54_09105 [Anaerolineae bacterium]|jgi:hypothetical protein
MTEARREPLFADLVFNEDGERVGVAYIAGDPFYTVPEDDFPRHVEAEHVDRQIVEALQARIKGMSDLVTQGVIHLLGEEDLFTRASIEHAIATMDRILEPGAVDVDELRTALWMAGLRAIVDVHGDLVRLEIPGWGEDLEP